jgi:D-alanyl-lipoteichoic acid acyltransferase DltB (MBOAT superfamily)
MDFFIGNINFLAESSIPLLNLALPLAISFFTFQQIAYLVDAYRAEVKETNLLNYSLFVTFFPQLIAGPIVHHSEMMPQFLSKRNLIKNYQNISLGLFIFSIGLFKKVAIADSFAIWATKGFDGAKHLNFIEAWITSLSYTFQLYFDFSGYTDMAIGIALLFNIKLPMNFYSPYKSLDIQDFWRRWHITLSRFLKDYVYIPLGGNRSGSVRTYSNLLTTFILGGIWHGAGWTFVFWGLLHGLALVSHRIWKSLGFKLPKLLAWFITFNFINITWVFFRATDFESAFKVLKGMFSGEIVVHYSIVKYFDFMGDSIQVGTWSIIYRYEPYIPLLFTVAFITVFFFRNSMQLKKSFKPNYLYLTLIIMFSLTIFFLSRKSEFIYFNF